MYLLNHERRTVIFNADFMVIFLLLADGIATNKSRPRTAFKYTLGFIESDHGTLIRVALISTLTRIPITNVYHFL